ncbi:hypothetical protein A4X09_0g3730 [Tilletia walkeri]|uniref:peptidylprolyl isomerase n=1 Tax=Tilletia walkeri TaxID=117179 RepID=A0A8X7NAI1_9BASI|nr:hypothetical protein A4X09_0g3730 [Tilletia walkeri]
MAAPPLSLFALHIPAGGEIVYPEVSFSKDFSISSITFAEELPEGAKASRSLVKVHHTPIPDDEDDSDDDYFESDDDEDDDEEDDDEDESAAKANGNGKPAAAKKLALGEHSVDVSTDEVTPVPEEQVHTICSLVPGLHETVTGLNVHCAAEDLVGFSVTGPYSVDLIGAYTANPAGMNQEPDSDEEDSDEEIDSDIYGENSDDEDEEIYFEDDDDEPMDPVLAGLLNAEDSGEEGAIEDPSRFQVLQDAKASKKGEKAANGKKRGADAAGLDADASMASAVSTTGSADGDGELTRNQRKRLNKKLKEQTDSGAAPTAADESTASTASSKAKKQVSFKDKEAEAATSKAAKDATAAPTKKDKAAAEKKEKTKPEEKKKEAKPAAKAGAPKKTTTASGLVIEDVKVGTGPQAKPGQRVGMRYIGKLTSGKQFDSNTAGKPFYFKLGRGEVIKGWDEGVKGMTIGSERRLTCPPQLAYGGQKLPGIPANSTLVFDVKLVDIK